MSKFKIGDKVKIIRADYIFEEKFINQVYKIIGNETLPSDKQDWWKLNDGNCWRWSEDELELVKEPIKTTEIKINGNGHEIIAKPFKIATDDLLAPNTVNLVDQYEKFVLGEFNKKEGNEMIESMNLIDLYASKHKKRIEKETKEKVDELRKNCDVINKYNELVEQFKKDCDELYLSQFTEEEKSRALSDTKELTDVDKQLRRKLGTLYRYLVNDEFTTEDIINTMEDMAQREHEIEDLVKTVKAHVGIAKTKEEVEEILDRYGIIKKGKLVI